MLQNYRLISLLSVVVQAVYQGNNKSISDRLEFQETREQASFRIEYSTRDQVHVINEVMKRSAEYNKLFYMEFIDYEKAFDSEDTAAVFEASKGQGIEKTYIGLLDEAYKGRTGRIFLPKKSETL